MIYYDVTKMGKARQRSGLTRVSSRIGEELGSLLTHVCWDAKTGGFTTEKGGAPVKFQPHDWLLTVELFSEAERPGFWKFLRQPPCRLAAIFPDAIPLQLPHLTWPHSVQRHPEYMKMLASFDRVWGISETVRRDLTEFWRWQGVAVRAATEVIELGADFDGSNRVHRDPILGRARPAFLAVGIVEPRKNQEFLLDVCEALWAEGAKFKLDIVGRVNPHFGRPTVRRMHALAKRNLEFAYHEAAGDRALLKLYSEARAVLCPTLAEGCGLPLLEALWRGVPAVASDLPVLRENAEGGGCLLATVNDAADWRAKLLAVLTDRDLVLRLQREAMARPLPKWAGTARTLRAALA
ncbi:MAG: glycosyltransferase [Opitutae bacterium]|nr:glycosyltransferase [Opitutae bacterium]